MEWWIPKVGDLFHTNEYGMEVYLDKKEKGMFGTDGFYTSKKVIPLLTEGQLRRFIEDKGYVIELSTYDDGYEIEISIPDKNNPGWLNIKLTINEDNLLQAYWKVALEIAEEEVKED